MEKSYIAEKDIKFEFPKIPEYSKPIIEGKKLEFVKNEYSAKEIKFTNGAVYSLFEGLLTLPNGEKFEGLLSDDNRTLNRGKYIWPNKQEYVGKFDEQNRFFTKGGEVAELTFPNGDIFRGEFEEGKITEGYYKTEGIEINADFTEGKANGRINYKDTIKGFAFNGYLMNDKKEGLCQTKVKIKNKTFSIKGEYSDGLKDGTFIIREISPNKDNLYIKGTYKEGVRNGYFDIVDKEKGINITHQYISFLQSTLIKQYNHKLSATKTLNV